MAKWMNGSLSSSSTAGFAGPDPRLSSSWNGTMQYPLPIGTIYRRTTDNALFYKHGSGQLEWTIQDGIEDVPAPSTASGDAHRAWLLANADWLYEEMDWSDTSEQPSRVTWRETFGAETVLVEVHTEAHARTPSTLHVHKPPIRDHKKFTVQDVGGDVEWRPSDDGDAWFARLAGETGLGSSSRVGNTSPLRLQARVRRHTRSFLEAYDEIIKG